VHLHNIYHHISPSILPLFKKRGIPVVMTLHDYKLIVPNYTMFHHGAVHEEDARGWYLSCVKNKCMKDSRAQSAIVTAEMIWHHKIMRYYEHYVDRFIAPSECMLETCVRFGWPREKFVHIPHPIDTKRFHVETKDNGYVLYIGRLSEEKGLHTLIDAAAKTPEIPYRIVGTGPLEADLQARVHTENINNVMFDGFQTGKALDELIAGARLSVLPSIWYENYPLSILEAKSSGKIVLGSDIGGISEMLPDDQLFSPGDHTALAALIRSWYDRSSAERTKVAKRERKETETINNPKKHVEAILSLYRELV
jgi:glycosyltransferase involved in cell wall biosynthesis